MSNVLPGDRACFVGMMLAALFFGAIVMLYIQLSQVLLRRPRRDRLFYYIVVYSLIVLVLTTVAIAGKFSFAEAMYVLNSDFPGGPKAYALSHPEHWGNIVSQMGISIIALFVDLIMFYRLLVLYNFQWLVLVVPGVLYLGRFAMAIPVLISTAHPHNPLPNTPTYILALLSFCVGLNICFTILISVRLLSMRHKAERVLGRLQATLYNSPITIFVESGAFFTLWGIIFLVAYLTGSWIQDAFWQPYSYVIALTRMLIALRMAQDRAWTREIISAAEAGVLDWGVSSAESVELGQGIGISLRKEKSPNHPINYYDARSSMSIRSQR